MSSLFGDNMVVLAPQKNTVLPYSYLSSEWEKQYHWEMCGRYTLRTPQRKLVTQFGLQATPDTITPRYNIAPTQSILAVRDGAAGRELISMRWGLIPSWAKDPSIGSSMINARSETAAEKPAFRAAFRQRRCLIVADGFYEWKRVGKRKVPHFFAMRDGRPFAFAGLWESWQDQIESCTILTTAANPLLAELHDRMPVIFDPVNYATWLNAQSSPGQLQELLRSYSSDEMISHPANPRVNSVANDDPTCLEAPPEERLLF